MSVTSIVLLCSVSMALTAVLAAAVSNREQGLPETNMNVNLADIDNVCPFVSLLHWHH